MNIHKECVENFINRSAFEFLFPKSFRTFTFMLAELRGASSTTKLAPGSS